MRNRHPALVVLGAAAMAALAGACQGDTTGSSGTPTPDGVGLSFTVAAAPSADRRAEAAPATHTLSLTGLQLVLGRIRMRRAEETEPGCAGPSEQHPCTDFRAGPFLVDLPVSGGLVTPITADVPPGSYRFILLNIFPPAGDDSAATAFRAANNWPRAAGMRVRGSYDGLPFDIFLNVHAEIYDKLDPPFVVTDGHNGPLNITVAVDPGAWFRTADGTLVDPRVLSADPHLLQAVTENIRASFRAFSDNQRHGKG
jgi:hypothetical protein